MIGKTVSHYKILEELGRGGMGVVYKAQDTKLGRTVALKFLSPQTLGTDEEKARFLREAQAAAALNHPNICTIYEIDEAEGQHFIAMELVEGESLKEMIAGGLLPLDKVIDITRQIAVGLDKAHEQGIVHRDIKSANIMIASSGQVKIMDFGLAKSRGATQLTMEGTTLGTIQYMSPEQSSGDPVDHRSDIWSLGIVLFEMVTGRFPFSGDYDQAVVYAIMNTEPDPLTAIRTGVPVELERIVNRCLEKDPAGRYQTARDLDSELHRLHRLESSGAWRARADKAKARRKAPKGFQTPIGRRLWLLLLCVPAIAILIIYVIVPRYFSGEVDRAGPERTMLAVLPFENLGPPGEEYFADGITEELIAKLAKIDGLGVIARTTVMRYKETDRSIHDIGDDLDVDYVLEGTIRWQRLSDTESRVRITPQLIRVSDETHLWAEVYQRDMTDIFAIQEEIAGHVASALDITLLDAGEKGRRVENPTDNTNAYHAYLEGRFWWNKRSPDGFDKAIALFDKAISIDPEYALVYAGKAECYCMLSIHLARPGEFMQIAREAAEKALEIDDTLPQAHSALGWIAMMYDYDYEAAESSFQRAIDLDPGYATTYNWYSVMLAWLSRDEEAVEIMRRAQQLDPASMIVNRDLACILSWVGRTDEAIEQLERTIDMDPHFMPAHAHLGRIYTAKGMYEEALAEYEIIQAIDSEYFNLDMMLAYTYAKMGREEDSRRILDKMLSLSNTQRGKAFEIGLVYAGLGDIDEAFEWFVKAVENREFAVLLLDVQIWMDDLRSDPRFEKLRRRINLAQ